MAAAALAPLSAWGAEPVTPLSAQRRWDSALDRIENDAGGRLGVAVLDTRTGTLAGWRLDERFPMCSTFKLVLAAWILHRVEQGHEQLDARVVYPRSALVPYSPVTGPMADTREGLSVGELCSATVSLSDNTAANLLLARHGGPAALTRWIRSTGDEVTRLDRIEPELNEAAVGDVRDTTTPRAMLGLMQRCVLGDALSPASRATLQRWLFDTSTGDRRLRAGAPGWKVANKTGTATSSGTANDIGVMWPPNGGAPLLVVCCLTRATAPPEQRDEAIAAVARLAVARRGG